MTGGLWSGKTLQKVFSKIITKVLFDLKITFDKYDRRSLLSPCFIQSLLSVNKPCVEMNKITMMTVRFYGPPWTSTHVCAYQRNENSHSSVISVPSYLKLISWWPLLSILTLAVCECAALMKGEVKHNTDRD